MWSKLDLADGFHQKPMKLEHRPITCMSTSRGTMQWTVLVLCKKNWIAESQRMMEWVFCDILNAHPYIDDIIVGSDWETVEELIEKHNKDIRKVLETLEGKQLVASPAKSTFFQVEVEFFGHVIREGARKSSPDKLLPLQKWKIPRTIRELRGFFVLTNYFSEYVKDYSRFAAPLMAELQVGREDGKTGSKKAVLWNQTETLSFDNLKHALAQELTLFQTDLEKPYILRCDANDVAIGAVLAQVIDGK